MALSTYNVSVLALFQNDEFTYPYWPDTDTRIRIGAFELNTACMVLSRRIAYMASSLHLYIVWF